MTMTDPFDFTGADLVRETRAAALAKPDYIYDVNVESNTYNCVNFKRDGSPSCVVGHGLHALGVRADHLKNAGLGKSSEVMEIVDTLRIECTDRDLAWLSAIQSAQDGCRFDWGECVNSADQEVIEGDALGHYDD